MIRHELTILTTVFCIILNLSIWYQNKSKVLNNEDFSPTTSPEKYIKDKETKDEVTEPLITMERTACLGRCPMYKLFIYKNGKVVYEGKEFVNVKGKKTITINDEKIKQMIAEIEKINFLSLKDRYEGGPTDAPSVILFATINGKKKTIYHYTASPDTPKELTDLENKIDSIIDSYQWIR